MTLVGKKRKPLPSAVRATRASQRRIGVLFVLPALLLYSVFVLHPFLNAVYFSLTDWNGAAPQKRFVGLANYMAILEDPRFWQALQNNIVWVVVGTAVPLTLGVLLAVVLWTSRWVSFFRAVYFLPFVLPTVVIAVVWAWIYHPLFGPINAGLKAVGLGWLASGWLGYAETALAAVLIVAIWATIGFVVVVILGALQTVDTSLVEAATLDGAGFFRRLWSVVIPEIAPVLTMVTTVVLVGGFSVFDIIFIMTGGGPGTATEVLATYTYKNAFTLNSVGYGAALSMFITALSLPVAILFVRSMGRRYVQG